MSSMDMISSSSASQSAMAMEERGDVSGGGVERCGDGSVSGFLRIMARFQTLILDLVLSLAEAFSFSERLRPGLYENEMSGRATLTGGLEVFEEVFPSVGCYDHHLSSRGDVCRCGKMVCWIRLGLLLLAGARSVRGRKLAESIRCCIPADAVGTRAILSRVILLFKRWMNKV